MKKIFILLCVALAASTAIAQKTLTVEVTNPSKKPRMDEPVVIKLDKQDDVQCAVVTCNGQEVASQIDDLDRDGFYDELTFLTDLSKKERKIFNVNLYNKGEQKAYAARTYAQLIMRNPKVKQANKQDLYLNSITANPRMVDPYHLLHQHGVAFENELVALRLYFDKRQTVDLYGKYKKQLELNETQFYTDANQKVARYGDDVLWVGNTFGLGAFRAWNGSQPVDISDVKGRTHRIIATGPLRTIVEIEDEGWKIDSLHPRMNLIVRYTLYAGHRDMDVDVIFNRNVNDLKFSTGIINVKNSTEYSDKNGIRGCWGTDWPTGKEAEGKKPETVGLGIYVPAKYRKSEEVANKDNYAFVIGTTNNKISYKCTYTSANESFGYHSDKEWFRFLKEWREYLDNPTISNIK